MIPTKAQRVVRRGFAVRRISCAISDIAIPRARGTLPRNYPGFRVMGKTVAASRAEVPNWFRVGVIASPGYDPPGFEAQVARKLTRLLGPKSRTHKIGIYGVWAEPVSVAVVEASKASGWHLSGHAVDRESGRCGWLPEWLMIAVSCDAILVFGPTDPTMETVLSMCREIRCGVWRV